MCRLSAIITRPSDVVLISDITTSPSKSIIHQSYASTERKYNENVEDAYQVNSLNGDGFGIGWYVPTVHRSRAENPDAPCVFKSLKTSVVGRKFTHSCKKNAHL